MILFLFVCLFCFVDLFFPQRAFSLNRGDRNLVLQHAQSKLAQYYDAVDENASTLNQTLKVRDKSRFLFSIFHFLMYIFGLIIVIG
jgi:hypothetical protein